MKRVLALYITIVLVSLNLFSIDLKVGYYNNPPLSLEDSGVAAGIVPDILNAIAEENDWTLKYQLLSFPKALEALDEDKIDILCLVAHSEEREDFMEFSKESVLSQWGDIYTKEAKRIESVQDLEGKIVAVLCNDIYYLGPAGIKKLSEDLGLSINFNEFDSYEKGMETVNSDESAAIVINHLYGVFEGSKHNLIPAHIFLNPVQLFFAFPKGKELNQTLINTIDRSLSDMKRNETSSYHKIIDKYTARVGDEEAFWVTIYLTIISVGIALFIWINNIILKRKVNRKTSELLQNNLLLAKNNKTIKSLLKNTNDMISLISEVGQTEVSEEHFMKDLLNIALKMVPVADAGSASLIEGDVWRFAAAVDHDYERLRKIPLKKEFVKISDKTIIVENIYNINTSQIPKMERMELLRATTPIGYTMITPLKVENKITGFISLDISKYSKKKFSEEYKEIMKALALLASSFMANKMSARIQHETQLSLVRSLVELVETRDAYTRGHSERVARYAKKIASDLFKDDERLNNLYLAGLLHDIGKIVIDDEILNKAGQLSVYEEQKMMEHPETGYRVLNAGKQLRPIANFVKCHHERWDGKGYPDKLKGEEIPLEARILTVADSFDAMMSERPYREGSMNLEQVIEELKENAGTQFDPAIVKRFIYLIDSGEIIVENLLDESSKI